MRTLTFRMLTDAPLLADFEMIRGEPVGSAPRRITTANGGVGWELTIERAPPIVSNQLIAPEVVRVVEQAA